MNQSDIKNLTTRQLEKIIEALNDKAKYIKKFLARRYVDENKTSYLSNWAALAELPPDVKEYFLEHCDLNDFILENGYYNYITNYGGMTTFKAWTCGWMLKKYDDYIGFRPKDEYHVLIPHHHCSISLDDIIEEYKIVEGLYDKYFINNLTEYVIYTSIKKKPNILEITSDNYMFAKCKNRHFEEFDCYDKIVR